MILNADVFSECFQEVNGCAPFPWQIDLVKQVLENHAWPQLIDVPTGMGKTALLDIAVFVAAATSDEVGTERLGRRRIFFVVDRRIVVDEAYDHAILLSEALESGKNTVLSQVANGLKAFAPEVFAPKADSLSSSSTSRIQQKVLPVTRMRGGITWDASWLDRPDIPGIVVGTVDQVGSRILFRGYGISRYRMPIDAALVGTDSLILVDEAHLAQAMVCTINEAHRRDNTDKINVPPATIVQMTATSNRRSNSSREPGRDDNTQFSDNTYFNTYSIDVKKHIENQEARRRLTAPKRMSRKSSNSGKIVHDLAEESVKLLNIAHNELLDTERGRNAILVVCNTVNRAREVYRSLSERESLNADIFLLIGRSRPADRDLLVNKLKERFGANRTHESNTTPAILVATQTVEVGANLDADGLVTESAPWDCLVQRLGRLNRLGRANDAKCIVVHDGIKENPIYGEARHKTWMHIRKIIPRGGSIDVSPLSCRELQQDISLEAYAPSPIIPLLTTPILDCWVRTSPVPVPDTPVAPYLHGLKRGVPTVYIAWRDGLMDATHTLERDQDDATADLTALPVRSEELVEVPLYAVRKWMRREDAGVLSDLDENRIDQDKDADTKQNGVAVQHVKSSLSPFRALVRRYDNYTDKSNSQVSWVWASGSEIRVGDTLVVPTERGCLDEYGWAPDSIEPVLDVAEVVRLRRAFSDLPSFGRKPLRPLLRIDEHTARRLGLSDEDSFKLQRFVRNLGGHFVDDSNNDNVEQELLDILEPAIKNKIEESVSLAPSERIQGTVWTREDLLMLQRWLGYHSVVIMPIKDTEQANTSQHYILAPSKNDSTRWIIERDDESPECSSMSTHRVTLKAHQDRVGMRAYEIARSLKLGEKLTSSVKSSAQYHDWGKVESRFQVMLRGGDEYEAMLAEEILEPLAKSGMDSSNRNAYRRALRLSGLPRGARHEAWSAALIRKYLETTQPSDRDPELIIHLIASHHGRARPWYSAVQDDDPRGIDASICGEEITVDSAETVDFEHPARFAHLNEKYGRWGLALLESIVRCADMTVSEEETRITPEEKL